MFFCWNEEGLLNFVSERIKLFYRINLLGTAFKQKNKLPFKLLKPQFIGRTHVLPNLSPYLNISYCFINITLKKYMIFYTLPWSRWNRTHKLWNTCVVPFAIAELGQKCLEAAPTCTKIFSRNKRRKIREESRWWSQNALVWPLGMSCLNAKISLVPTTSCKNVETLPRRNDLSCFKSLLVTGLWDIILTPLLPPIQSCSSKFWAMVLYC